MKWRTRLLLQESAFTAIAFTIACYSYYYFSFWGPQDQFRAGPLKDYMTSPAAHLELLSMGVLFGAMIGVIHRLTETPRLFGRSVGLRVLLRSAAYLVTVAVIWAIVFFSFAAFVLPMEALVATTRDVGGRYGLSLAVWFVLVVVAINLALEVGRLLGPQHVWRLLIGRYQHPRMEERVFLFMDLKNSTGTAERLGHEKYSELLQQCFRDLTSGILEHGAAVYQYVGDEVVLSWPRSGRNERASALTFFAYEAALWAHRDRYESRFETVPEFRGGIAAGPVTVSEVGEVKREIVYHGDVLNTAARLLELAKARGERLMVTADVALSATGAQELEVGWTGEAPLRGKKTPVSACALQLARGRIRGPVSD
jgi:adenylate cyclase